MSTETEGSAHESADVVRQFLDAWARQDFDGVMERFDDNAIFKASTGPEPGRTFVGRAQIASAVEAMFEAAAGSQFNVAELIPFDGGAVATWFVSSRDAHDEIVKSPGIDVFRVHAGKITLKDAFRKLQS